MISQNVSTFVSSISQNASVNGHGWRDNDGTCNEEQAKYVMKKYPVLCSLISKLDILQKLAVSRVHFYFNVYVYNLLKSTLVLSHFSLVV